MTIPTLPEYLAGFEGQVRLLATEGEKNSYRWGLVNAWATLVEREFRRLHLMLDEATETPGERRERLAAERRIIASQSNDDRLADEMREAARVA